MNNSDKQRFARYKKGYIAKINEFDDDKYCNSSNDKNNTNNNKNIKLGYIDNIDVKIDDLVKSLVKK